MSTVFGIKRLQNMSRCRKRKKNFPYGILTSPNSHYFYFRRTIVIEEQLKGIERKWSVKRLFFIKTLFVTRVNRLS